MVSTTSTWRKNKSAGRTTTEKTIPRGALYWCVPFATVFMGKSWIGRRCSFSDFQDTHTHTHTHTHTKAVDNKTSNKRDEASLPSFDMSIRRICNKTASHAWIAGDMNVPGFGWRKTALSHPANILNSQGSLSTI